MQLIDSDLFIWHLRGYDKAQQKLRTITRPAVAAVTYMELLQGARNKAELRVIRQTINALSAPVLPLNPTITNRGIDLLERFSLSHGLGMGDALIAATALDSNCGLVTGNRKHFEMISGLAVEIFHVE